MIKLKTVFVFFLLFASILFAQIPRTISYQGVLTDNAGNPKADGDYNFAFSFYEAEAGGDAIWSEAKTLTVTKGLFSTSLGDITPFGAEVKFDKPYWLGIKVGTEAEISPRIALTSSGYSFSSINSDTTKNIINGKVVKSINGLKDNVTLEGDGGTTVSKSGNKITISSSSGSGSGIQGIQNTNNTLSISNPNGPTATVNLKAPLYLAENDNDYVISIKNTGNGSSIVADNNNYKPAIFGQNNDEGSGVYGESQSGSGIFGYSPVGIGVYGQSDDGIAVFGESPDGTGISGESASGNGVYGHGYSGVYGLGFGEEGAGVYGQSNANYGVSGLGHIGVYGQTNDDLAYGVYGSNTTTTGAAVCGNSPYGFGVYGVSTYGSAGYFVGDVAIIGTLDKLAGSFKIDHPLDPANKYLYHSFVESPDMKNIYDGVITTDANGSAMVTLPDWFEALNKDFRYQLTVIGQFAQAIIQTEIQNNQFTIKTDKPNVEVSWQVTGIRHDAYAEKNRIPVEEYKKDTERGKYLSPELFGQTKEEGIGYLIAPKIDKQPREIREKMNNKNK